MTNFNGAPASPFTGVHGWESISEQEALLHYAALVPDGGQIVEIGAEFGMSASLFCKVARAGVKVWSVDLFPRDLMYVHQANLAAAGLAGRSKQIKGDSWQVGRNWQQGPIDLLFIDGDHTYEGVMRDIAAWLPHVRAGGTIIFHDAAPVTNKEPHQLHHEVHRAIDDALGGVAIWREESSVDTMRIFIFTGSKRENKKTDQTVAKSK